MKRLDAEYACPIPYGVMGAEPGEATLKLRYQVGDADAGVARGEG